MHLLLALGACALSPATSEGDPIADYAASTGHDFIDCGRVDVGVCGDQAISIAESSVVDCVMQAQADCSPAWGVISRPTIEGDPIDTHWLVVPEEDRCTISKISDTRADAFGVPAVWLQACDEVEALERCPWLENGDCGDAVEL